MPWKLIPRTKIFSTSSSDVLEICEKAADIIEAIPEQKRNIPRRKGQKEYHYRDCICAFDIETTNDKEIEESFMYIWQFCIYRHGTHRVILGRTWEQFRVLMQAISRRLGDKEYVMVYIHNADFEFTFLTSVFKFSTEDVFCLDKRRVARFVIDKHIEFRCSHKLTNLSLATFTKQMGVKHRKLDGEKFDYSVYRTPGRALKRYELNYCINDVLGLCEAVEEKIKREGDDLYSVCLTATGYIRRECKKEFTKLHYKWRRSIQPDYELLEALKQAFRGGNVHGNRLYALDIQENVHSADRSSSYPEVIINHEFPGGRMWHIGPISWSHMRELLEEKHLALLMKIRIWGLKLKDDLCSNPYLPSAKIIGISNHTVPDFDKLTKRKQKQALIYEDNGRVLAIRPGEFVEYAITDVDLRIICSLYEWDYIEIFDSWGTTYKPLPQCIRDLTIKHYRGKTGYKGVEGMDAIYLASKERLNSIYGMMCQNPVRPSIVYDQDAKPDEDCYKEAQKDKKELLESYSKKGFLPYQWAVWVTAWSRYELQRGIRNVESQGGVVLYVDTDSVKYMDEGHEISWDEYNREKIALAEKTGAYADDPKGERHYMGVFEYEGKSDRWVFAGAKKYVGEKKGKLEITIAGVPKKKGAAELQRKGGIDAFSLEFMFEDAGLAVKYNDHSDHYIERNGETIHITNNMYLYKDTYIVGIEDNYERAINIAKQVLTECDPFAYN